MQLYCYVCVIMYFGLLLQNLISFDWTRKSARPDTTVETRTLVSNFGFSGKLMVLNLVKRHFMFRLNYCLKTVIGFKPML